MKEVRPTTVDERIRIAKECIANGENYGETAIKFNVSYQPQIWLRIFTRSIQRWDIAGSRMNRIGTTTPM